MSRGLIYRFFLKTGHVLSANQAINLILKVLNASHAAHNMGAVHRDIKPANIMIVENGQVKVTDFGVARIDTSDLTQIGDVMGTPSYMSPEAREGNITNHLSDIYTTALVLVELLIQKRLKAGKIDYLVLIAELNQQSIEPTLAAKLATLVNIALQPKPQQRYQDALSFYKALSECLDVNNYSAADDLAATVLSVSPDLKTTAVNPQLHTSTESNMSVLASKSEVVQSQLTRVEKNLTSYLGPAAKMLVKKQAKKTDNISQLLDSLVSYIPSDKEREKFIEGLDSLGISQNSQLSTNATEDSTHLNPDYTKKLTEELAFYVGPVAKHLMKSALKKVNSKAELHAFLAKKIPNESEKSKVLKMCEKL